jgi:DNA-directed RNA polymerase subunit alpha
MVNLEFNVKEITLTSDFGEFAIEPLEPGYGYTVGNAIRRVLYTSIPGCAITSIKISGVKHRFSTVPGLKENVIDFLLNLKELHISLPEGKDSATVRLTAKGPKDVTGADVEATDGVEVANPDHYLGSLSGDKSKLEMELTVERGTGYSLSEDRKENSLGVIATDAIFTPVRRVTYSVEATRVGRQTNLDKLVLKIWTNGTIAPRAALDHAARLLASHFLQIYEPNATLPEEGVTISTSSIPDATLKLTIDELDLPTRIYNSLRNGGIETVEQLINTPRRELVSMRNMGGKSIEVIDSKLQEKGITITV